MDTDLGSGKYLLLTTYRKNGQGVPTPVWVAQDGDKLVVWTVADSGKVKRIRRSGDVRVGPCDVRGRELGPQVPAKAELLDETATDHVKALIRNKYGLQGSLVMLGSTIRRGRKGTVGIALTLV